MCVCNLLFFSHTTQLIDDIVIAARPGSDSIGAAESVQLEGVLMVHFGPSNVRIMYTYNNSSSNNDNSNNDNNDNNDNKSNKFRYNWMNNIIFRYVINRIMNAIYNKYRVLSLILIMCKFILSIGIRLSNTMSSLFCIVIEYGLLLFYGF